MLPPQALGLPVELGTVAGQSMARGPEAPASPGNLLEIQSLVQHPDLLNTEVWSKGGDP